MSSVSRQNYLYSMSNHCIQCIDFYLFFFLQVCKSIIWKVLGFFSGFWRRGRKISFIKLLFRKPPVVQNHNLNAT